MFQSLVEMFEVVEMDGYQKQRQGLCVDRTKARGSVDIVSIIIQGRKQQCRAGATL